MVWSYPGQRHARHSGEPLPSLISLLGDTCRGEEGRNADLWTQLLSQLTTRIRLYGANCNDTALVMQAIQDTKVEMTIWPAICTSFTLDSLSQLKNGQLTQWQWCRCRQQRRRIYDSGGSGGRRAQDVWDRYGRGSESKASELCPYTEGLTLSDHRGQRVHPERRRSSQHFSSLHFIRHVHP